MQFSTPNGLSDILEFGKKTHNEKLQSAVWHWAIQQ